MSLPNTLTQTSSGGTAILPDTGYRVIDYDFPPTNYQSAPQPTLDTDETVASPMPADRRATVILEPGALVWDTTLHMLFVGDGVTKGGVMVEGGGSGGDFTQVTFWQSATV